MIEKYLNKLDKNRIRKTVIGGGVKVEVRERDEEDNLVWSDKGVIVPMQLDVAISEKQIAEAEAVKVLQKIRADIANLEAMKADLFPQLKK